MLQLPHQIADAQEGARGQADHHPEARERERAHRAEEAADVAPERQRRPRAEQHPAGGALDQFPARRHPERELTAQERADQRARDHAEVQQRSRVEPWGDEIGSLHHAESREHPVAPVAHAVGGGERTVEGEQEHVGDRGEDRRAPHRPRPREERLILVGEHARLHGRTDASARVWATTSRSISWVTGFLTIKSTWTGAEALGSRPSFHPVMRPTTVAGYADRTARATSQPFMPSMPRSVRTRSTR